MKIENNGELVVFKSRSPYFEKERNNQKCNTVRYFLDAKEQDDFVSSMFSLNTVRIEHRDTNEWFERLITNITAWTLPGLVTFYIISWESRGEGR